MAGKWDSPLKRLVEDHPQDFVTWLLHDAIFERVLKTELSHRIIHTDMLLAVEIHGIRCVLHLEFQAARDPHMAKRLWEYNVRATVEHDCPVFSFVIYLKKGSTAARSPLLVKMPDGQEVHRFRFGSIELAEVEPEELRRVGVKALLPLLPLTRKGKRQEVVDEVIEALAPAGEKPDAELLIFALEFASLVFQEESEREWIKRRFSVFHDILRETWVYQEILQEGVEKGLKEGLREGLKEGLKEGLQEGKKEGLQEGEKKGLQEGEKKGLQEGEKKGLEGLRQTLLGVVQARFPELTPLAQVRVAFLEDLEAARDLIIQVSAAQTVEEAQQRLLDVSKNI